jgi:hypothetical protein
MLSETPRSREQESFRTQEHMQDFLDGESIDEVDCHPHADNRPLEGRPDPIQIIIEGGMVRDVQNMPSDYAYEVIDLDIENR